MHSRAHHIAKTNQHSSSWPVISSLQTRPFEVQTETEEEAPPLTMEELEAQQQWQERHGYNLSKISITSPGEPPLPPLQANRLVFGQPGDKYEQEADRVAAQVVKQINAPAPQQSAFGQTLQREGISEEEKETEQLQTKPVVTKIQRQQESPREEEEEEENLAQMKLQADTIQRQEQPAREEEEEENLAQMKLQAGTIQRQEESPKEEEEEENLAQMKPMVQRQFGRDDMAAMPELEASIQQARSGGQPLDENVRKPIEQAFGADFSGVRVHTDSQSDTLNRSLQARAFTTGEDVFFRQGEYNPVSQQGQELLAHELTHVVQQNGDKVQRQPIIGVSQVDSQLASTSVPNSSSRQKLNITSKIQSVQRFNEVDNLIGEVPVTFTQGEITRRAEGTGPRTLTIHWPHTANSGVTLGYGYDMGGRNRTGIITDLTNAGVSPANAAHLADAAGLRGNDARDFVTNHNTEPWATISDEQRTALFNQIYPNYQARARELATSTIPSRGRRVNAAARGEQYIVPRETYDQLHPVIREILTDLTYPGQYSYGRHESINPILNDDRLSTLEKLRAIRDYLNAPETKGIGRRQRIRMRTNLINQAISEIEGRIAELINERREQLSNLDPTDSEQRTRLQSELESLGNAYHNQHPSVAGQISVGSESPAWLERAVERNAILGSRLGWESQIDEIVSHFQYLGFLPPGQTPNTETFARAVRQYQQLNSRLGNDGILGPNTWHQLRAELTPSQQQTTEGENQERGTLATPPWITIAQAEIGVEERSGERHHPRIIEYHSTTGRFSNDETPWCASFVNWVLQQAGQGGTGSARALSFCSYGRQLERPAYGSIAVFSYGGGRGHVGFVVGHQGNRLLILGGNQGNKVQVRAYDTSQIIAYVVPPGYQVPNTAYDLVASEQQVASGGGVAETR
jgi:uncharacterized protein (TIGR02594 family)